MLRLRNSSRRYFLTDVGHAIDRLQALINQILAQDPQGFVVVATLTQCSDAAIQARMDAYNAQVKRVVGARVSRGDRVELVDMASVTPTKGWKDFVHPDDAGYQQMAYMFQQGVGRGIGRGLLPGVSIGPDTNQGASQRGGGDPDVLGGVVPLGSQDLNDVAKWQPLGDFAKGNVGASSSVRFLDFDGDGDDDYGVFGADGAPYLLAMANAGIRGGRGTNGSQFFITAGTPTHLQGEDTIFGEVADEPSRAVVDAIISTPTDRRDRPEKDVVTERVTVERG